ncbi:MAG: hypothetical protein ISR55_11865 [Bacteroidetes bacterium]|nr:hypothetical protein [Bacteroidota bacterium]
MISIIVPIVKNANKKKRAGEEGTEPEKVEEDIFETLKEQFSMGEQSQEVIPEPEIVEEAVDDFLKYDDEAVEKSYEEATKKAKHTSVFTYDNSYSDEEIEVEELQDESSDLLAEDITKEQQEEESFKFDPVDAVIYSEILKRPDYL